MYADIELEEILSRAAPVVFQGAMDGKTLEEIHSLLLKENINPESIRAGYIQELAQHCTAITDYVGRLDWSESELAPPPMPRGPKY